MAKTAIVAVLIALVVVGGGYALYYFTMPGLGGATTASTTVKAAGYQNGYTPEGIWANFLGYLPVGYNPAPHGSNAPTWPCPSGMSTSACQQFQSTCGNGVCDPNESCSTCPLDCAPAGEATCDPYTGRAGAPISVCFLGGQG